jgi:hypothetical protein
MEDGERGGRWTLYYRDTTKWVRVASYHDPMAAALAVASGDTGIHEWDDVPRDAASYELRYWQRHENVADCA